MSATDKQELINSICKSKPTAEEANQAFESIVSLLKDNEHARNAIHNYKAESEDFEEEEEEEEDSESEDNVCNKCEKRKFKYSNNYYLYLLITFFYFQ